MSLDLRQTPAPASDADEVQALIASLPEEVRESIEEVAKDLRATVVAAGPALGHLAMALVGSELASAQ